MAVESWHFCADASKPMVWSMIEQGGLPFANIAMMHGTRVLAIVRFSMPIVFPATDTGNGSGKKSKGLYIKSGKMGVNMQGMVYEPLIMGHK